MRELLVDLGDWFFYRKLAQELKGMESVLDLGCGRHSPLAKIKKKFFSVGVDIFQPSIKISKKRKIHDHYQTADALKIGQFFKRKSFDCVIALDLIEHFKKEDGLKLLKKIGRIAKKKIIILTPNGFTKQDPLEDNPYQIHQSGWTAEELRKFGFRVYGMRGLKFIRGEYATIKYRPWFFWGLIATLSQLIVYFLPEFAYQLFGVQELIARK